MTAAEDPSKDKVLPPVDPARLRDLVGGAIDSTLDCIALVESPEGTPWSLSTWQLDALIRLESACHHLMVLRADLEKDR